MTPIAHLGTGLAATGIVALPVNRFLRIPFRAVIALSLITSVLPDIDGLSLFISHKIYYGKEWYSHHMFGHSLTAALVTGLVMGLIYLLLATTARGAVNLFRRDKVLLERRTRRFAGAFLIAFTAYLSHLAGDMLTPPGPWGGIALFWPDKAAYGGWDRIFWHNWYIVYMSLLFTGIYLLVSTAAGFFSLFRFKAVKRISGIVRTAALLLSIIFIADLSVFVSKNSYGVSGYKRWEALNRSLVPDGFLQTADMYYSRALGFWKKTAVTKYDLLKVWNGVLEILLEKHGTVFQIVKGIIPRYNSPEEDLAAYRSLQGLAPGMEDSRKGKYRLWIIKDSEQKQRFYDRGFILYYISRLKRSILQATDAWMIIYHIDKTDSMNNATEVSRVYYSNKIFVPDRNDPLLKNEMLKSSTIKLWDHVRIPYNLIPRAAISRNRNLLRGFYPSLNTVPGFIWPGRKTGIMLHSGAWSEGCIVSTYGHLNLGSLLQSQFHPVWSMADNIIDTRMPGSAFKSRERIWGRMIMLKIPDEIPGKGSKKSEKKI